MEVSNQFYACRITSEEGPRYPLDKRLGGPQGLGCSGEDKKKSFSAHDGNQTSVAQPLA
jgi:hypothetical protein